MPWQTIFFILGSLFFLSWFIFMVVVATIFIIAVRRLTIMQANIYEQIQLMKEEVNHRFNQPPTKILMALVPLIPTLIKFLRRRQDRND